MLKLAGLETARSGYTERVFTEIDTDSGLVKIVDNVLNGGEIVGCEDRNLLRWRIAPHQVGAPGCLGGSGEYVPFGKVMFFPAAVPYRTRRFNHIEQNRCVVCYFKNDLDDMISELSLLRDEVRLGRCFDISCGRIDGGMQRIAHELTHPGFATELLIESLLTSLAVDLCRYFSDTAEEAPASGPRGLSAVHLRRVTDFITSAREGVPTSAKLADLCGLPPSSFRQRFKQSTGQSIHSYVEEVRLARAKAFLTDTEMSMKEIAYELGFTHQATFTTSFRRATGVPPSEYRQMHWN